MKTIDLPDVGRRIAAQLDSHFDPAQARTRQVLALVEEAGEFADAYLLDSQGGDVAAELADVLITAHVTAAVFSVELPELLAVTAGGRVGGWRDGEVIQVVACAGRVAGAYRRSAGMARRSGPVEDVAAHLREVVRAVYDAAFRLRIDLDAAVAAKVEVVFSRGWRDPAPAFDGSTVDAITNPQHDALYDGACAPEACDIDGSHDEVRPAQRRPRGAISPGDPDWVPGFGPVPGSGSS